MLLALVALHGIRNNLKTIIMITLTYKKEVTKKKTIKRIVVDFINNHKYKWIHQNFTANWSNLKLYPRFWLNKSIDTPNFNHWSFTIRFLWWYFGIKKKFINEQNLDE